MSKSNIFSLNISNTISHDMPTICQHLVENFKDLFAPSSHSQDIPDFALIQHLIPQIVTADQNLALIVIPSA